MNNLYPLPPDLPSVGDALEFGKLALKAMRGEATESELWTAAHFGWQLSGVAIRLKHPPEPLYAGSSSLEASLAEFTAVQGAEPAGAVPWGLILAVAAKVFELWLARKKK